MNTAPEERHRCWAEIDTAALRHNAAVAAERAGGPAHVIAVIKADAYGHGMVRVAAALRHSVGTLAVASVEEARQLSGDLPVLILSPALPEEMGEIVRRGWIASVSTPAECHQLQRCAVEGAGELVSINAVLDTGMGRMGALPADAPALLQAIAQCSRLRLVSLSSHFPSSDEDPAFTTAQHHAFRELIRGLPEATPHIANSAAILTGHYAPGDHLRAGLMLYGVSPMPSLQSSLRPVLTWKSRVTLVRELPAGWGISYGRTHVLAQPSIIATIAAGYGDGYPRHLSGREAAVLIHGQRCPLLGRVTMDQIMVDVTAAGLVQPGDTCTLLGRDGQHVITAAELASLANTIPWHIFTSITSRTHRVYIDSAP